MDALAGYGSDDSSSSETPIQQQKLQSALSELLVDVSEASDDDNDNTGCVVKKTETDGPPSKKSKLDPIDYDQSVAAAPSRTEPLSGLPDPPMGGVTASLQGVEWSINYLKRPATHPETLDKVPSRQELQEKLQRLGQTVVVGVASSTSSSSSSSSWANHLRSQHEFHNPHFFASVVDHFGIRETLGSQIRSDVSLPECVRDYERKLFPIASTSTETPTVTTGND